MRSRQQGAGRFDQFYRDHIKRWGDVLLSVAALPVLALATLVIAPIIYFEDRGPVFYVASRLGMHEQIFRMYKFRSMKVGAPDVRTADGSTFNSADDPRLTRIGAVLRRTSLDELPQVLNVLRGDMSLVGPRPDLPDDSDTYSAYHKERLDVRPGITGYTQAYFRNSIPAAEKLDNDVHYVRNVSLGFDLRILLRTALAVVTSANIYSTSTQGGDKVSHVRGVRR